MNNYPIFIFPMNDIPGTQYYLAYLPDFGSSTCSATGDTPEEAISELQVIYKDVFKYYTENWKEIPIPTKFGIKNENSNHR